MSVVFKVYKCDKDKAEILFQYLQGLVSIEKVNDYFFNKHSNDRDIVLFNKKYAFYIEYLNNTFYVEGIPSDRYLHDDLSTEKLVVSEDILGFLLLATGK